MATSVAATARAASFLPRKSKTASMISNICGANRPAVRPYGFAFDTSSDPRDAVGTRPV